MPPPGPRYHAFISHAPEDNRESGRKWVDWLFRALELFEVPAAIAGKPTPAGPVPKSLFPTFHEARPLGADGQLDPAIREALEQSRVLVVICSPRAARSAQVTEEIRYFKQLGRERVLALIVAGEPGGAEECLPDTLRHDVRRDGTVDREWRVTPPSADVRLPGGLEGYTNAAALQEALRLDGASPREVEENAEEYGRVLESAKMKLIAGALGVPLPEILKRVGPPGAVPAPGPRRPGEPGLPPDDDARPRRPGSPVPPPPRRNRLGFLLPLFLLALAATAGWYAWLAEQRRLDADSARRRADSLLAWVQRDLGDKLISTKNIQLLAETNDRLTDYFNLAVKRGNDPAAVPALADSLALSAEIALARTAYPAAVALAAETIKVRERAIAERSSSDEMEVRLLGDHRRLSQALSKAGKPTEAVKQAEQTRIKVNEVLQRRGSETEVLQQAVQADYECGDLLLAASRLDEAKPCFESGLATATKLATAQAGNIHFQQDVATGEGKLGDVLLRKNDPAGALLQYRAAQKSLEALAKANPDLDDLSGALAALHGRLGGVLAAQRNFAASAPEYRQEVEILEPLAASHPANAAWQFDYATSLRQLAETLLQAGPENKLESLTLLQRALDHATRHLPDQNSPRSIALRAEIERVKLEAMK